MIKKRTFIVLALGLLFFYLLVIQVIAIWPFTIDDMYISLRYAKNWEQGNGLLWNVGEQPVEGYSNFLFVCLAALALKLGLNPVITLKAMGAISLAFASATLYRLSRFWFLPWLSLIPVLWLLFYRDQIFWVSSGLETTTYQALLLLSVYSLLRGLGYNAAPKARGEMCLGYWLASGLFLALAGLTRPEGGVVGVVFFAIAYLNLPKVGQFPRILQRKQLVADHREIPIHESLGKRGNEKINSITSCFKSGFILGAIVFVLIYGVYFLWRWHYFGLLMPNSVYCKGFATSHWLVLDKLYLKLAWPFLLLGLAGVLGKKNPIKRYDQRLSFLWIPSLIYLIFLVQADPVSAMAHRLFLPAFVFLLPLTLLGIQNLMGYLVDDKGSSCVLLVVASSIWFGIVFLPVSGLEKLQYFTNNSIAGEKLRWKLTDWLKHHVSLDDRIVLGDSGLPPYYIPSRFEDSYCLNNKRMGNESYAMMFEAQCQRILQQKPEVIIVASLVEKGKVIYFFTDQCLNKKLESSPDYRKSKLLQTSRTKSRYRYQIYLKE